jgi:F-type H+-transporting ATPase subunit c
MKRIMGRLAVLFSGAFATTLAQAAEGGAEIVKSGDLLAVGSGLAIGLAVIGGALGQGKAAAAALEGMARNPSSQEKIFMPMILALALIEFQAIMGFIIAFLWYTK